MTHKPSRAWAVLAALAWLVSACAPQIASPASGAANLNVAQAAAEATPTPTQPLPTPYPERPRYGPGELVDYVAQAGDTLPALAVRFNTTVAEIRAANTFIPGDATTMPSGMPMKIPIYYLPFWGSPYKILPDGLFVDGPAQVGFDTQAFINAHPGWLKTYVSYAADANRTGGQIIDLIALEYSVSPRLLLALLEYQAGALSQPVLPPELQDFPLNYPRWDHKGLYMQLNWAANLLNNGFYGWRSGELTALTYPDGRLERFDPWLNASSVALRNYFNTILSYDDFLRATSAGGFARTYAELFGDPWLNEPVHIPGSLAQPELYLPFQRGDTWAYTGGPHTGWGLGAPFSAIDFAIPGKDNACGENPNWATAVAPGKVVRSETGVVVLDLDGDGDERTGWTIFYLHVATVDRVPLGATLERGDKIGHPSCEGGNATGSHIHLARKYNGEWMLAEGALGFNLEGWQVHSDGIAYLGTMTRNNQTIIACTCSNQASFIRTERQP